MLLSDARVVSLLFVMACWTGAPPAPAPAREVAIAAPDVIGAYRCAIDDYPAYACVVRRVGDQLVLEKLAGSQRFRGVLVAVRGGFEFRGAFYCPWGACDKPVEAMLVRGRRAGELSGTLVARGLRGAGVGEVARVRLRRTGDLDSATAFGGAAYGGAAYGGAVYGGRTPIDNRPPRR